MVTNFLEAVSRITDKGRRELADSVLEVSTGANMELIELLRKEGDSMSGALMEIFEPEINEIKNNIRIVQLIITARKYGASNQQIAFDISSQFECTEEDAERRIKEYDEGLITV